MASRRRFCFIENCENADGSLSRDIQFYRMPVDGELRQKWIDIIEKYQCVETCLIYVNVCSLHFAPECILKNKKLKKNSVPTLALGSTTNVTTEANSNDASISVDETLVHEINNESVEQILSVELVEAQANPTNPKISMEDDNFDQDIFPNVSDEQNLLSPTMVSVEPYLNDIHEQILEPISQSDGNNSFWKLCNNEALKRILDLEIQLHKKNERIALLEQKCDAKNYKISRLELEISRLKKLQSNHSVLSDEAKEIIRCLEHGKESKQYDDAIRSFAFTIHFYRPRAYKFIRDKFNKHLPDPSTIRSWISNVSGVGEPGICAEAIHAIGMLVKQMKDEGKEFCCSLVWDEMNIRKHCQWCEAKKKFLGFISYGSKENNEIPVASQALTFLVTGINVNTSIPVSHFFIKLLNGVEKAYIVKEILRELSRVGAVVVNVSFDGFPNNFTACTLLGASFKLNNFKPYFMNPFDGNKVHITPDACHMLKLTRNCLGDVKLLQDGDGQCIEWKFFENLEKYRVARNFVSHKVTKKHILYNKNKMDVPLAAQLYSKSVANSMLYLANQKCHGFEGCEATAKFALMMNNIFDIFNSRVYESNIPFKNALTKTSANAVFTFLDEALDYLKSLKLNGQSIIESKRRTGFKGFIMNIINLKSIYALYVETDRIKAIPTFQLSQDLLESYFSRIRQSNGCAENPTVTQFTSAFRKLLIHNEIKSSEFANCEDKLNILTVSSRRRLNQNDVSTVRDPTQEYDENLYETISVNENEFLMDCCEEVTIATIAGSIEGKIENFGRFNCNCTNVLKLNEKVCDDLSIGDAGAKPCVSTLYVCKIANICFNQARNQFNFNYDALLVKVMQFIDFDAVYKEYFDCDESHKIGFIKYVVEEFIRLQATYIAKNITLAEQKIMCRKQLQKKVHFLGQ